jgi:glutathione S-transferase
MLKIYGAPHSRAFCVLWLANEIGIPYELIPVMFNVPTRNANTLVSHAHPNGLVTAIDDGGFVMWETSAINLYLAETYKNSLYPSKQQGRGRMLQWAFFATTEVEPALIMLFRNRIFFPPEQRNEWPFRQKKPCAQNSRYLRINSSKVRFSAAAPRTWPILWLRAC